jgi:excisionase family DNA binding protein
MIMADEMPGRAPQRDRLLTPGEVATLFRVDPKTVTRWASAGRINSIRTPGGHRRFRESEVRALLRGDTIEVAVPQQQTVANTVDLNARRMAR